MQKPSLKLLLSHPAHFISLGFGSGLAPRAPGTFGSILAFILFLIWQHLVGFPDTTGALVFLVVSFILGCFCAQRTGKALGLIDHGAIVWDEFIAVWLTLLFTPATLYWQFAALVLFRIFDITKPWPIRQAERRFKTAFGVMLDDLLAAGYSLLILFLAQSLFV